MGERVKLFSFKGTYYNSVDHKGRLSIPVKFREAPGSPFSDQFVVARGFEGCLYIYPPETWARVNEKLDQLKTLSNPKARFFERTLLANAADVKLDTIGRLTIPQILLDLVGIKKDVVIRGIRDKIELWDPEILRKYEETQGESYEDVAGQLLI